MIFTPTRLPGAYLIEPQRHTDERGFFARTWCEDEFAEHGLKTKLVQCSISFNARQGTLRGMHVQGAPYEETKLVRCTSGAIYDVLLDLRPQSPTCGQWIAEELSAQNRRMLYVPQGVAHGFQTLTDNAEVFYQISEFHHPECAYGVRWNDPIFGIEWPLDVAIISERDRTYSL